ncbi:MAG: baseplate J/gp47 family protein [Proteobacteria bacterium]|nr:baseplate J/gp47 family protein [Pseudomonadota bacterium]
MGIYDNLDRYTQTALLQTALNAARDDVDKREGAIMYDALAPLAFLAARLMEVLKGIAENADIQTAQGENLDWAASQFGIYRAEATAAIREAQATPDSIEITQGATFRTDAGLRLVWICTENLGGGKIVLQCQTAGQEGGADYGTLTPEDAIAGLESLDFTDTRSAGTDAETDTDFRIRFWKELQREAYGGNFADYQKWIFTQFAQEPNGALIRGAAIFPAWSGGGTIKIVPYIETEDSALEAPTAETLEALKAYLDPEPAEGKGAGVAPIGHAVTIEAPTFEPWEIEAVIRLRRGEEEIADADRDAATADVKAAIEAEMLASVTQADSAFPTAADYTFEFTKAMLINAIMGDAINQRFLDVEEITVNGEAFEFASYPQTATEQIMPRFSSLTLTRSE